MSGMEKCCDQSKVSSEDEEEACSSCVGEEPFASDVSLGSFGKLFLLAILYRLSDTFIAFNATCRTFTYQFNYTNHS